jgi:hypothetical protein
LTALVSKDTMPLYVFNVFILVSMLGVNVDDNNTTLSP